MSQPRASAAVTSSSIKLERQSLFEGVVSLLRGMIVTGQLQPGERLWEQQLCDRLGVSRTPLREALKVLAHEGLIHMPPNRGALVNRLSVVELNEVVEVLANLEILIGRLATERADAESIMEIENSHMMMIAAKKAGNLESYFDLNQEIHAKIIAAATNPTLFSVWQGLNAKIQRYRFMANLHQPRWERALQEHEEILTALKDRDGDRLGLLLRDHLMNTAQHCRRAIAEAEAAETTTD